VKKQNLWGKKKKQRILPSLETKRGRRGDGKKQKNRGSHGDRQKKKNKTIFVVLNKEGRETSTRKIGKKKGPKMGEKDYDLGKKGRGLEKTSAWKGGGGGKTKRKNVKKHVGQNNRPIGHKGGVGEPKRKGTRVGTKRTRRKKTEFNKNEKQ